MTKHDAAIAAGYSESTARQAASAIEITETFKQLVNRVIPDDKLAKVMSEGLAASNSVTIGRGEDAEVVDRPDYGIRHKYLETGLKVKGHLNSDNIQALQLNIVVNPPIPGQ